jgi:ubiquinone/menaquinone biosynthesis C-methylase UbiE
MVKDMFETNGYRTLLDFGCGAGFQAMIYAKIGYTVTGFDITESYVENARELAAKYGFTDQTEFSVQTAENLPYTDGSFDVVAGVDILHHVEIELAAREIRRVLRPQGIAIFKEPAEVPIIDSLRNSSFGTYLLPKGKSYERYVTEDERKLSKSDFQILREHFARIDIHDFGLFSKLHSLIPVRNPHKASRLEMLDYLLMTKLIPLIGRLGQEKIIRLQR